MSSEDDATASQGGEDEFKDAARGEGEEKEEEKIPTPLPSPVSVEVLAGRLAALESGSTAAAEKIKELELSLLRERDARREAEVQLMQKQLAEATNSKGKEPKIEEETNWRKLEEYYDSLDPLSASSSALAGLGTDWRTAAGFGLDTAWGAPDVFEETSSALPHGGVAVKPHGWTGRLVEGRTAAAVRGRSSDSYDGSEIFNRSDTAFQLQRCGPDAMLPDLRIDEERQQLNFVERNFKGKSKKLTKRLLTIDCADKLDCLQLLRAFTRATSHLRCQYFWQLPSIRPRLATSIDDMLRRVRSVSPHDTNHHLDANGLRIPCGRVLPAAYAVCKDFLKLCLYGGWARGSDVMQDAYIDPSWRSTDAARYFFGWLRDAAG
ncbi:CB domain-containing protein [Pseudoscourfieldia marina]